MTALPSGNEQPIRSAGRPTSISIGRALNQNSVIQRANGVRPASVGVYRTPMGVERLDARPSKARQRRDHQQRLHHHQAPSRPGRPPSDVAAEQRSGADAHEHDREDERKDGPEAAKQQREVAEPDDLQAHAGEAAQRERKAVQATG